MDYLFFDVSDNADGVITLEALASTQAAQHDAVLAEVRQVLDWAWHHFPHTHGHADDGMDWAYDLQDTVEPGSGAHNLVPRSPATSSNLSIGCRQACKARSNSPQ